MLTLWAKLERGSEQVYHPLVCHALDVAAVVRALWETSFPGSARRRWQAGLGSDGEEETCAWLCFWAALHDLGKASPAFQSLSTIHRDRLRHAGYPFPVVKLPRIPHGTLTRLLLPPTLTETLPPAQQLPPTVALALACALGGHHGVFDAPPGPRPQQAGEGPWKEARVGLVRTLAEALDLGALPAPTGLQGTDHAFYLAFAGLVSVADWIGSDERFFQFQPDPAAGEVGDYVCMAERRAREALKNLGWGAWQPPSTPLALSALLRGRAPRPMQELVAQVAGESVGPDLVLIEAPMGEGKTEAALYLADHWNRTRGQRGAYVALPTQATANAMFSRYRDDYLWVRYGATAPPLRLLHGHAVLVADREQPVQAGELYAGDESAPGSSGALTTGDWFGYRKRGLLGPLAVGTIDQALMSVLQARHGFVRLFGLADKTVVLDEVHAFDTYTSALLDRLLCWLKALGCTVVLLSATLPARRRQELLAAFGAPEGAPPAPYPRVTTVGEAGVASHSFASTPRAPVHLERVNGEISSVLDRLRRLPEAGGCVAWVCNTVGRAQEVYQQFATAFEGTAVVVDLFHARYPFAERARRESRAVTAYGVAKEHRPKASILVATQVVEQSLDLDFDLMISDLAPVDLLLQRSGRLHRHSDTVRPPWLAQPALWLCEPHLGRDGVPDFGASAHLYGDYLLLRTWLTLRDREQWRVPDDVEALVEAVYGEEALTTCGPLAERLAAAREEAERQRQRREQAARTALVFSPALDDTFLQFAGRYSGLEDNDDPAVHPVFRALTRYSETPSTTIICLRRRDAVLGVDTAAGFRSLGLDTAPPEADLRALLEQAVSVASYLVTEAPAPVGWQRCALLRYCRAVVFDEAGEPLTGAPSLRLDPHLGVVVRHGRREGS